MMQNADRIGVMRPPAPDDLLIVCSSFEPRCTAVAELLQDYAARSVVIVHFVSKSSYEVAEDRRQQNEEKLFNLLTPMDKGGYPRRLLVSPHNPPALWGELERELMCRQVVTESARISIDITCFTKIHLAFLLRELNREIKDGTVRLLYTVPERYGTEKSKKSKLAQGYIGPLVLPFRSESPASLETAPHCKAVVAFGHEGERVLNAWRFIEPQETILIRAFSENEKWMRIAEERNQYLLRRAESSDPTVRVIDLHMLDALGTRDRLFELLGPSLNEAAYIAIIPFGPKPVVAGLFFWALSLPNCAIDIVYPIATWYDPYYTDGVSESYWVEWSPMRL